MSIQSYRFLILRFKDLPVNAWFMDWGVQYRKFDNERAVCAGGAAMSKFQAEQWIGALNEGHDRQFLVRNLNLPIVE